MGWQEREMMGRDVLNGASIIGIAGDRVTIRFPRKRYLSISTTHAFRTHNRGAKRVEFKRF
jgi:hypothetical protein